MDILLAVCNGFVHEQSEIVPYVAAQCMGAMAGAGILYLIASGQPGFSLAACFTAEVVLTAFFLFVILGATDKRAPAGFAPIPIGLCLTVVHLIGIPVTNLSVNPARSLGPAVVVGSWALGQLWLFWLAPISGAIIAGVIYPLVASKPVPEEAPVAALAP